MSNPMAVAHLFPKTSERVVWKPEHRSCREYSPLHTPAKEAISWDGAKPETNGALCLERHEVYAYVEIRRTGHAPRVHTGGIFGLKAQMRFTGTDDSGEWIDCVIQQVAH